MKRYRDWSIFAKIMGLSLATWLLLVIAAYIHCWCRTSAA